MKFIKIFTIILFILSVIVTHKAFAISDSVTVLVIEDKDVTATLTADSYTIDYDSSTVLHILSTNTTSCTISSNGTNLATKTNASWDLVTNKLTSTTKYDLNCKNNTKNASDTKTITVKPVSTCSTLNDSNYGVGPCSLSCKNGADNYPTCTTKGGACLNGKTNPPTCDDSNLCTPPTSRNIQTSCDLNSNGDAAISGSVTRSQTKVAPSCTFNEPVTTSNSTYVSDNCVYPPITCSNPTTRNVQVACDLNSNGDAAISGSVTRSQTKVAPSCTFGEPVTVSNSTYVSDNCVYPSQINNNNNNNNNNSNCLNGAVDPMCLYKEDGTCVNGSTLPNCELTPIVLKSNPQVLNMDVKYQGKSIRIGNTTSKIPYNSKVVVSWGSSDAVSCILSYSDSKSSGDILSSKGTSYPSPGLKRDTNYTVICKGSDGKTNSDSVKVLVSPINTGYTEQ